MVRTTVATLGLVMAGAMVFHVAAAGKPGYPDKIAWGGITWDIKTSRAVVGPGPNVFAKSNVSVDTSGALHLRIANSTSRWPGGAILAIQPTRSTSSSHMTSRTISSA